MKLCQTWKYSFLARIYPNRYPLENILSAVSLFTVAALRALNSFTICYGLTKKYSQDLNRVACVSTVEIGSVSGLSGVNGNESANQVTRIWSGFLLIYSEKLSPFSICHLWSVAGEDFLFHISQILLGLDLRQLMLLVGILTGHC